MINEEINKYLTEAMGECWHEWIGTDGDATWHRCIKCYLEKHFYEHESPPPPVDFFTWEGFGKLWEWASKREWWTAFCVSKYMMCNPFQVRLNKLIHPTNFANVIYKFLQERS